MWHQVAGTASVVVTAVGAVATAIGTVRDHELTCRIGFAALLVGLTWIVIHRGKVNTQRLIDHQEACAKLHAQECQEWARMGWRAARIDIPAPELHSVRRGKVVRLPDSRSELKPPRQAR